MSAAPAPARDSFGTMPDGSPVESITLVNGRGADVQILTLGATIRCLRVPDRSGQHHDVVLGYDSVLEYCAGLYYLGAVIGRYANRIRHGRFELDGRRYALPINNGPHHLHGGPTGFHKALWTVASTAPNRVTLARTSPHGEEGYPGTVMANVTYTLTDENVLGVEYCAATDRATPINLTQHSYFNLRGAGCGTIREHELIIHADRYLPADEAAIPLGELEQIAGTPFDFTARGQIGARLGSDHPQIRQAGGFDHCYALRHNGDGLSCAAEVFEPRSGRKLEVWTSEPGMQLYTGQFLQPMTAKHGRSYGPYAALCLETQHFPDSPNRAEFPTTILRFGETYRSRTEFRFGGF